jgi:tRNA threonylcarbamoyladenosine biosynthesis protein TsaE
MMSFSVLSDGPERTGAIAGALAPALRAGDVILLTGGLATGKTTLVRAVAAALGSPDQVTSPTFSIAHAYSAPVVPVLHIDAYRLSGVHEFRDLGLDEYIDESITLVEWGDIVAEDFSCHLLVNLACEGAGVDDRLITLSSDCDEWLARLPALRHDLAQVAALAGAAPQRGGVAVP